MFTLPRTITKAAAVAVLLGSAVVSASSFAAQSDDMAPTTNDTPTTTSTTMTSTETTKADPAAKMEKHVEVRIKTLHDELKITPEQDAQWETVAQTMRDNEQSMSALVEARHNNAGNMTAIDDVKSYQAIAQSHADGLAKFITAFEPLYNSMSDDQKKIADSFFSKSQMHHGKKHMMKKSTTSTTTTK